MYAGRKSFFFHELREIYRRLGISFFNYCLKFSVMLCVFLMMKEGDSSDKKKEKSNEKEETGNNTSTHV